MHTITTINSLNPSASIYSNDKLTYEVSRADLFGGAVGRAGRPAEERVNGGSNRS